MGLALGGRLLKACLDRGVEPQTSHRAVELIMEDGEVAGVVFETPEGRKEVRAPNVVIATGGFEHNAELKRAFLRGPCTHTVAVETNTGDGLKMAMRVGAMLGNMREAWWMPMIELPTDIVPTGQQLLTYERTLPGAIMVNQGGQALHQRGVQLQRVRRRLPRAGHDHGRVPQPAVLAACSTRPGSTSTASPAVSAEPRRPARTGSRSGDTPAELAEKLGIPADALEDDDRAVQRQRARPPRSRLQAGLERAGQVVGRPDAARRHRAGLARAGRDAALLRDPGVQRRARDQGRTGDRHATRASSTSTATSSPASTRRATRWPRRSA